MFVLMATSASAAEPEPVRAAHRKPPVFAVVDLDKNGSLTLAEFKTALAKRPRMLARAEAIFTRMDKNADGKVDATEYKAGHGRRRHLPESNR